MRTGWRGISPGTALGLVALLLAMGGAAYAGSKVDTSDLAAKAVTGPKLAKNAVTTSKLADNAVTGDKVKESTLGAVPALEGRITFFQPLSDGQSVEIAQRGLITLYANCAVNQDGFDEVSITARTAQDGAVMDGYDDHNGAAGTFLNVPTPGTEAELVFNSAATGQVNVDNDEGEGFVIGPDGRGFSIAGNEARLGLNLLGAQCFVSGTLTEIG